MTNPLHRLPARLVPLLASAALLPAPARGADAVGAEACKECHEHAYEAWQADPHAKAERGLGDHGADARCQICHAPQKAQGVAGVSCEGCHGAGQYYVPSYVMRDAELARAVGLAVPKEKECLSCHDATSPSLEPFRFEAKKAAIDHWTAERAAREQHRKERAAASTPKGKGADPKAPAPKPAPKPAPDAKPAGTGKPGPAATPATTR